MPDNSLKRNINYELDHKIWQYPDWRNYEIKYRPDIYGRDALVYLSLFSYGLDQDV